MGRESIMAKAIESISAKKEELSPHYLRDNSMKKKTKGWCDKITDHVAWALLVYTGLLIFMVMGAISNDNMSILPYFSLFFLVGMVIPGCRSFEKRWAKMTKETPDSLEFPALFRRDVITIWVLAIGLPFVIVGLYRLIAMAFA